MNYSKSIFEKLNVQAIQEQLVDEKQKEALDKAYQKCLWIVKQYDTAGVDSELFVSFIDLIAAYESIIAEISLKAGFLLKKDILRHRKTSEHNNSEVFIPSDMAKRLNLQSIGYHIKEGSNLVKADKTSFTEREVNAEKKLEKELQKQLDAKSIQEILPVILEYANKIESIQFSIGMKIGAKLESLLISDYEYDF